MAQLQFGLLRWPTDKNFMSVHHLKHIRSPVKLWSEFQPGDKGRAVYPGKKGPDGGGLWKYELLSVNACRKTLVGELGEHRKQIARLQVTNQSAETHNSSVPDETVDQNSSRKTVRKARQKTKLPPIGDSESEEEDNGPPLKRLRLDGKKAADASILSMRGKASNTNGRHADAPHFDSSARSLEQEAIAEKEYTDLLRLHSSAQTLPTSTPQNPQTAHLTTPSPPQNPQTSPPPNPPVPQASHMQTLGASPPILQTPQASYSQHYTPHHTPQALHSQTPQASYSQHNTPHHTPQALHSQAPQASHTPRASPPQTPQASHLTPQASLPQTLQGSQSQTQASRSRALQESPSQNIHASHSHTSHSHTSQASHLHTPQVSHFQTPQASPSLTALSSPGMENTWPRYPSIFMPKPSYSSSVGFPPTPVGDALAGVRTSLFGGSDFVGGDHYHSLPPINLNRPCSQSCQCQELAGDIIELKKELEERNSVIDQLTSDMKQMKKAVKAIRDRSRGGSDTVQEVEVFPTGKSKTEVELRLQLFPNLRTAVKELMPMVFTQLELFTSTLHGQQSYKSKATGFQRPALDSDRLGFLGVLLSSKFMVDTITVESKMRNRLKMIRDQYSGIENELPVLEDNLE